MYNWLVKNQVILLKTTLFCREEAFGTQLAQMQPFGFSNFVSSALGVDILILDHLFQDDDFFIPITFNS